jgi:hypothetical protein
VLVRYILDPTLSEGAEDAPRDLLRDRHRRRHRTDHPDLGGFPDTSLHEIVVQQERTFEGSGRALERVTEDPDQDRPRLELGEHVAQSLGARERVVLEATLLKTGRGREVIVRPQRDDKNVGVVGRLVGRDAPRLRIDRRHALAPELDPLLRDLAVIEQHVGRGLAAEQDVQLRVPEHESRILVDERYADLVGKRLGEARRKLQAAEAGAEDHDLLLLHASRR